MKKTLSQKPAPQVGGPAFHRDTELSILADEVTKLEVINQTRHRIVSMEIDDEDGQLTGILNDAHDMITTEMQERIAALRKHLVAEGKAKESAATTQEPAA
jgi:hypothetical protein